MIEGFDKTTIGADYLKTEQVYPVDLLLDYLHGLIQMREGVLDNEVWFTKYTLEIEAVKEILKIQTDGV